MNDKKRKLLVRIVAIGCAALMIGSVFLSAVAFR